MRQNDFKDRLHLLLCAAILLAAAAVHALNPSSDAENRAVQVFLTVGGDTGEVQPDVCEVNAEAGSAEEPAVSAMILREVTDAG